MKNKVIAHESGSSLVYLLWNSHLDKYSSIHIDFVWCIQQPTDEVDYFNIILSTNEGENKI